MNKTLKKVIKIITISLVSIVAVFVITVRAYFRIPVRSYYKISKKAFVIPGIRNNYVAQGICYDKETNCFYLTGYMSDNKASPIYVVNKDTKKLVKSVFLEKQDGTDINGHTDAISIIDNNVYIASPYEACLYVFSKNEINNAKNNSKLTYHDVVNLYTEDDSINIAFTTVHNGMIYAGEFYKAEKYETRSAHHFSYQNETNKAIVVGFKLDGNTALPEVVYSIPNEIQGMSFGPDAIVLSSSWGTRPSDILKYNFSDIKQNGTMKILGKELPLYVLNSSNITKAYKIAPMSEEIEYVDGRYFVSNESASNKYVFGKFTSGKWCLSSEF